MTADTGFLSDSFSALTPFLPSEPLGLADVAGEVEGAGDRLVAEAVGPGLALEVGRPAEPGDRVAGEAAGWWVR